MKTFDSYPYLPKKGFSRGATYFALFLKDTAEDWAEYSWTFGRPRIRHGMESKKSLEEESRLGRRVYPYQRY